MTRSKSRFLRWPMALTELVGFGTSMYLALLSFKVINVPCPRFKWAFLSRHIACESVLRGPHSHIFGVSVALLGVLYFIAQLGLTAASTPRSKIRLLKLPTVLSGLIFVAYLRAVELVLLDQKICHRCWGVAVVVLVETMLAYSFAVPPMPKIKMGTRIISVILLFGVLVLASVGATALAQGISSGTTDTAVEEKATTYPEKNKSGSKSAHAKKSAPTPTPTPAEPVTANPIAATTTESSSVTPAPTPTPKAAVVATPEAASQSQEAEEIPDTPETRILRARGWRVVASTPPIEKMIKKSPPVLLLAYDPQCEECHALIHDTLSSPEIDSLPVNKVAIDQAELTGTLSDQVKAMPTLMVIDATGKTIYKHEGRMSVKELMREIGKAFQP